MGFKEMKLENIIEILIENHADVLIKEYPKKSIWSMYYTVYGFYPRSCQSRKDVIIDMKKHFSNLRRAKEISNI